MLTSIKDRVPSEHEHVRIVKFEYRALRAPQNMIRASEYPSMLGARPTPTCFQLTYVSKTLARDPAPSKHLPVVQIQVDGQLLLPRWLQLLLHQSSVLQFGCPPIQ